MSLTFVTHLYSILVVCACYFEHLETCLSLRIMSYMCSTVDYSKAYSDTVILLHVRRHLTVDEIILHMCDRGHCNQYLFCKSFVHGLFVDSFKGVKQVEPLTCIPS